MAKIVSRPKPFRHRLVRKNLVQPEFGVTIDIAATAEFMGSIRADRPTAAELFALMSRDDPQHLENLSSVIDYEIDDIEIINRSLVNSFFNQESLGSQNSDTGTQMEAGGSMTSDSSPYLDTLEANVSRETAVSIEALASSNSDSPTAVELGSSVHLLSYDSTIQLEWYGTFVSDSTEVSEWTAAQTAASPAVMEDLSGRQSVSASPVEVLFSSLISSHAQAESSEDLASASTGPLEYIAGTITGDAIVAVEVLSGVQEDADAGGEIVVAIQFVALANVEVVASMQGDFASPLESSSISLSVSAISTEETLNTKTDATAATESLMAARRDAVMLSEIIGTVERDATALTDIGALSRIDSTVSLEQFTTTHATDIGGALELVSAAQRQNAAPAEIVALGVAIQSVLPIEVIVGQAAHDGAELEWAGSSLVSASVVQLESSAIAQASYSLVPLEFDSLVLSIGGEAVMQLEISVVTASDSSVQVEIQQFGIGRGMGNTGQLHSVLVTGIRTLPKT